MLKQAQAYGIVVDKIKTRNEVREELGLDPSTQPEANQLGVDSPTSGFIPLGSTPAGESDTADPDSGHTDDKTQVDDPTPERGKKR